MRGTNSSRTTIRDIAREAGVSTGTVSRVLNRHPNVHHRTRTRVLETMRTLGYEPVFAARELGRGSRPTIGLSTGLGTRRMVPFFHLFLEHLTTTAVNDGLRFIEVPTGADGMPEHLPDGLVLFGVHDDDARVPFLQEKQIPFVLIGHDNRCHSVASDDFSGGTLAMEHLLRLGHREIVVLTGEMTGQASQDRLAGAYSAMEAAGLSRDSGGVIILKTELDALGGYRAVQRHISTGGRFSAIMAVTDELALGARVACEDNGRVVPEDVSITGFDDLPEIAADLTTVRQDFQRLAATAIRMLSDAIDGSSPDQVLVPVHLITRGSTSRVRRF